MHRHDLKLSPGQGYAKQGSCRLAGTDEAEVGKEGAALCTERDLWCPRTVCGYVAGPVGGGKPVNAALEPGLTLVSIHR